MNIIKILKRKYNTFRNIDSLQVLRQQIAADSLKIDELNLLKQNIEQLMLATKKWEHLHKSTTSSQFPSSIRIVLNNLLHNKVANFDKVHQTCCFDPLNKDKFKYT
jgi:hypothetical protein